ncbi:non-ribosomal peptide synthetase [Spirilliplanes yamanashiensis]|uniref:Carrier domain-containing protein n=1 Tax=Spirilliplanes yamanashiensis TaxID=42233 RepID=A0A8J3Y6N8_9ACTN|nr:non-ribosomal peptide synthetase [Spirilliplanes yamanashiensis]MDP9814768.1 enterobactin synthetase component F [Spirilliplanes yamanashiensis]GIJ02422.1 hypothetical protein Sya03_17740 [Spirilliplanes yamanashiensis]
MTSAPRRPLTTAQQALWFAQQLDPDNPVYTCAHYVDLRGPLDADRLLAAIGAVTAAADVLTTRFETDGADVWQVPAPAVPVPVIDLRAHAEPGKQSVDWMRAETARPRPLTGGDLAGHALLLLGDGHARWYLRAHHILLDGFGFSLVTEAVAAAYAALGRGEDPAPRFAPLTDLLADEAAYERSPKAAADREFWLDRLTGAGDVVSLTDGTAAPGHGYVHVGGELTAEASDAVRAAAERLGVTWAELVFAATALYVHRMTGAGDVVLGVPVAGRLGSVAARVPSTVVNIVPLRVPVPPDLDLAGLARRVRDELRLTRRHRRYRYERLQRDLGLVGSGRRLTGPQVNVKPFDRDLDFGDVAGHTHYLATGPVDDLELKAGLTPDGRLELDVDANPRLYTRAQAAAHRDRLIHLLTTLAAADPATPAGDVPVTTPAELTLVTRTWNDTAHPVPDATLVDLLESFPADAPAVRFEGAELTYAQLHRRANRLAHHLIARGAGPGAMVAVAMPRSADLVVALLGVLKAGAAYLPLDLSYPADRLDFMLADAAPVAVLRSLPPLDGLPDTPPAAPLTPQDPAYAIYTSGSTGRPKGVLVPHRGIVNRLLWMQAEYGLTGDDRVLQKTPYGFDVSVWEFFWPLITGATLVVARPDGHRDPAYLADVIVRERVTTVHFVPSMLRAFLPSAGATGTVLRRVICSGEELPEDLVRQFHREVGAPLHNLYGPTEASVDVTFWECAPDAPPGPVPIGRPVWNTRLYVLDAGGRPVPPGAVGELFIAGTQVALGYLNRPELTAERFVPDPWGPPGATMYRTGDLARWRDDGALDFLGRTDHQVKIRGFRVELGEIEGALLADPGVTAAAVVPWPGRDGLLVAYLVGEPAGDPRARLAAALPDHMVPAAFVGLPALPLTTSGKLDRRALPEPPSATASGAAPRTPVEETLCGLFAEALGVDRVGVDDGFFDLGGHSLLAMVLTRRIRDVLGADLPLGTIFTSPTPARLAAALHSGSPSALDVLLPLRPADTGPALFVVHPAGGLAWCYSGLLRHLPPSVAVYGLQSPTLSDPAYRPPSLSALAARYADEILAVRPAGPVALAGWSVGGVLAHEVAVRLRARGVEVPVLALLDAYPGDQWRDLPAPDAADALRALLTMAGLDESAVPALTLPDVLAVLRAGGHALAELGEPVLASVVDVVVDNARLMREHTHAVFDGGALFFTAARPRPETWLDRRGWQPYLTGELVNHDLDCLHPGLVRPAALSVIGRELTVRWGQAIEG